MACNFSQGWISYWLNHEDFTGGEGFVWRSIAADKIIPIVKTCWKHNDKSKLVKYIEYSKKDE